MRILALVASLALASCTAACSGRDGRGSEAPAASPGPHVRTAFFYGTRVPIELLARFDRVVVKPEAYAGAPLPATSRAQLFAYVSVGEVNVRRNEPPGVPRWLVLAHNAAWGTDVVDTRNPKWQSFLLDRVVEPLYAQGFRGLFLDTLDSYKRVATGAVDRAAHANAIATIVSTLKRRHPDVRVVFNGGFDVLPLLDGVVIDGLVAESLFDTADPSNSAYRPVPEAVSTSLLGALRQVRAHYGLPIAVIDYVEPLDRGKQLAAAARIYALGFDPWISVPSLDAVGVGGP